MVGTKATLPYHQTNVQLMDEVYRTTGDPEFKMYRDKWGNYEIALLTSMRDKINNNIKEVEAIIEMPAAQITEKPVSQKQPGFEGLFALTGLTAVAYVLVGKNDKS